jgi:peptidoglycan/xylan/chitin deacetylase (PgdA/CDA1 family)
MYKQRILIAAATFMVCCSLCLAGWHDAYGADRKVFALCYHSFLGNKRFAGDVSLQEFRSQVNSLRDKGFRFVSYQDILKGSITGSRNVFIVIDDGNKSVYQAYHEVLKPLNIRPMLAIYPSVIGKKPYTLTWEQLQELSKGCDIASHGYYHLHLDQKLYEKDKDAFLKEIYLSKETLEKRLNCKVSVMVYPNGIRSDITKQTLKEAGYANAFTIVWGPLLSPLKLNKDPYELPRYMIYQDNWGMIANTILKASAE